MKRYTSRTYDGIPLGFTVKRSIAKTYIYRVRRGRGIYGEKLGETIQDRYTYFVPDSINNTESEPYRRQWSASVSKWQTLSTETKNEYDEEVKRLRLVMSGFNLFMRKAMRGEVVMSIDRGDLNAWDYQVGDFTTDNTWRDLDLSAIVSAGAKMIIIRVRIKDDLINKYVLFRKKSNSWNYNLEALKTKIANIDEERNINVFCDTDRVIQYRASAVEFLALDLYICGWWT